MSGVAWWAKRGVLVLVMVLGLAGCGAQEEEAVEAVPAEPTRVEDEALGIAVVIPAGSPFVPAESGTGEIRLRFPATEEFTEGTVTYAAEPEQYFGVNLVEAVNERKAAVEERPQGDFLGQVELGHEVLGTAYSTRARFEEDGQVVEEIRIFAVHPAGNRLLHMTYRYEPGAGQTQARMMDQAFEAFGYIEPLATAGEEAEAGDENGEDGTGEDGAGEDGAAGDGAGAAAGDGASS